MAQQNINYDPANSGLGDTLRQAFIKVQSNFTELFNNKVDKVTGWGLSQVNFSQADKDKLDEIDPDLFTQSDWDEGNSAAPSYIQNKPTDLDDFDNAAGYIKDVEEAGNFYRTIGAWVSVSESRVPPQIEIYAGTNTFEVPTGAVVNSVLLVRTPLWEGSGGEWSQTGTTLTITKTMNTGNRIQINFY